MTEPAERPPRGRLPKKEPDPFPTQLRKNIVSTIVIGLSAVALLSFLLGLFGVRMGAVVYLVLVLLKLPVLGLIVVGAFVDKSRWWLAVATVSYLSVFLVPNFLGLLVRLQEASR